MKKNILFVLLYSGITFASKAQLTVSGSGLFGNDTPLGVFYNITTSFTPLYTPDPGTHIYVKTTSFPGCGPDNDFIIRIGNYWYMGDYGLCGGTAYNTLQARYIYPSTSIDPPCVGTWEKLNYTTYVGLGIYNNPIIGGITCSSISPTPIATSATILPNLINLPRLSHAAILSIATPQAGMITFDVDNHCVSYFDGATWNCMMPNFGVSTFRAAISRKVSEVTTSGYTINDQHNVIIYFGPEGTMNLPLASTCVGREYIITNYGGGALTLNISYQNGGGGSSINTVRLNTTVHLISNGSVWLKIN